MKSSMVPLVAASLLASSAFATTTYPDCVNGPLKNNLVCNPSAAPADRAAAVIAAMNIDEKLANLRDNATGAPRIGLSPYEWWSEALHGVASSPGVLFAASGEYSYATSFALPITFSSAFDDDMVEDIANIVSTEGRAFSNDGRAGLDFFTPNINGYRDPRWGRGMETPGEDPYRIKQYVNRLLLGLEGGLHPQQKKVVATCKHFAGYDLETWDGNVRYGYNAVISSQDLAEYYLPPFQQCARDNQVGSIMCSYNAVNGVPSCANTYLLEDILRDHWGWTEQNQYVTSDCNAVSNIYENHKYVATNAQSVGVAFTAGTDQACQAGDVVDLVGAYNQSLLSEGVIDQALRRQYEALVRLGYFDPAGTNPYRSLSWANVNTPEAEQLALDSATRSIVMQKNDGILPMDFTGKSVALIGMWANATEQLIGSYAGIPPYFHGPLHAAQQMGLQTYYADGPTAENTTTGNWTDAAMQAANSADIILYFGGIDLSVEAEAMDRYQIGWSPSQLALIEQISSLGKPVIVSQLGDQLDATPLLNSPNISAVLWTGYPGQDGGTAVFDIMTGKVAPAGRLPVTQYPANYVNEVPMTDMSLRPSATNPGRTYKWYNQAVLPFGYGLHYTNFSAAFMSNFSTSFDIQSILSSCTTAYQDLCTLPVQIPVQVTNTGSVTSDYVTLLFASSTAGPSPAPLKSLVSYERLGAVAPQQSSIATLTVQLGDLARRDENGNLILYPGAYTMMVDYDSRATATVTLTGSQVTFENWPQPPPAVNPNSTTTAAAAAKEKRIVAAPRKFTA